MPAYHHLEKNHHVSISEYGDLVTCRNTRVRYYIELDTKNKRWIYYSYSNKRDYYGDFTIVGTPGNCLIRAGFDQVSKFNRGK